MRLLVVEDDAALAGAIRTGLNAEGMVADVAGSVDAATSLLTINPYDAAIVDLGLPDGDGLSLVRSLRGRGVTLPVLILTARGTVEDRVAGLNAGGDDYLQKPFAFAELVARIRALLRRGTALSATVLRVADLEIDVSRLEARRAGQPLALTVKEFAILEYLARHHGQLVTRTMLLEHCWDESYDGLSNLVDVHVSRLRRKLDLPDAPPLLHTVRGAGFILEERAAEDRP